jgi:hypothetical protein
MGIPSFSIQTDQVKRPRRVFHSYFKWLRLHINQRTLVWKQLFTSTVFVAFLYIFMEWIFFVTMPSFMSLMSLTDRMKIFVISGWIFTIACLIVIMAFIVIDLLALPAHLANLTRHWGFVIPSIILSALILLLVDNFTYTIFKFGISNTTGILRGIYAVLFVLLNDYIYLRLVHISELNEAEPSLRQKTNRWFYASLGILVLATGLTIPNLNNKNLIANHETAGTQQTSGLPNIILLGSDGLNADNLSVYGYYRDTTPQLKELAKTSLVAENAFTNAGNTAGSVISIMTSKLPTQTRVLYPPDILTGIDSFQHLPGILNNLGYQTVEFGVPFYIDAYNYNLQDGFDLVNDRSQNIGKLQDIVKKLGFENEAYFLSRLASRVSDRVLHIFFIRQMENPYNLVTQPVPNLDDQTKIDEAMELFDQSRQPLFIHIHLLGTHGGYYSPSERVFSAGERQITEWLTDFYDDTLIGFDNYVGEVIDHLKATGQYDNTILIIYTDHNKEFKVDKRIPLIIHFPGGEQAGEITKNVKNMDIAPTILDYLGIARPDWMEGESLLNGGPTEQRLIFSTGTTKIEPNEQDVFFLDPDLYKPPFYQFSFIDVVDCQKVYSFELTTYKWSTENVTGYINPCSNQDLLSFEAIRQAVYTRLATDGFDLSSLP